MNMAKVVVGSEGTLVTFTRAKVRMAPRPKAAALAVVHFHTILESFEATVALLDSGASAIEQMDNTIVRQGRAHPGLSARMSFVEGDPASMLIVEASGDSPGGGRRRHRAHRPHHRAARPRLPHPEGHRPAAAGHHLGGPPRWPRPHHERRGHR